MLEPWSRRFWHYRGMLRLAHCDPHTESVSRSGCVGHMAEILYWALMRRHGPGSVHGKRKQCSLPPHNALIRVPRRLWESSLFIRTFAVVLLCGGGSPLTRNHCHRFYLDRLWTRTFTMVKRPFSHLISQHTSFTKQTLDCNARMYQCHRFLSCLY